MRALAICAIGVASAGCFYYEPGSQAEQADAIVFYPPDARIDAMPEDPVDIANCAKEIPCPEATSANRINVCGRIWDVETGDRVGTIVDGEVCREGNTDGACILDIEPYSALDFAQDTSTPPLGYASKYLDTCGRFQLVDVIQPQLGYLGLGVDDAGGADEHGIGGAAMAVSPGQTRDGVTVFAIRRATDAAWTSQAGLTGLSFVERGVILLEFHGADGPASGVTATEGPGADPANDYYFSDTTPNTRRTVDPTRTTTGANGAALMVISNLVDHSGTGGGCNWTSGLATTIEDVMFYAPRECL